MRRMLNAAGLGVLGIDPITAAYLLAMGLRRESRTGISLFFLSFAGCSVAVGTALATLLGTAAPDFLQRITPDDDSLVWAIAELAVAAIILAWTINRIRVASKRDEQRSRRSHDAGHGHGSARTGWLGQIAMGLGFAVTSFTDPTFYAVTLIAGESRSVITALLLTTIWFMVSQCMAVVVYLAVQCDALGTLTAVLDRLKGRGTKAFTHVFHGILIAIALLLIADATAYLATGSYLI